MKTKTFFILILLLFFSLSCEKNKSEQKGTRTDSKAHWFTENDLHEVLSDAKKQKKSVFLFFYKSGEKESERFRNRVFTKREFAKLSENLVLLAIDKATDKGNAVCSIYKISKLPYAMVLNKSGKAVSGIYLGDKPDSFFFLWLSLAKRGISSFNAVDFIKEKKVKPEEVLFLLSLIPPRSYQQRFNITESALKSLKFQSADNYFVMLVNFADAIYFKSKTHKKATQYLDAYQLELNKFAKKLPENRRVLFFLHWSFLKKDKKQMLTFAEKALKFFKPEHIFEKYPFVLNDLYIAYALNGEKAKCRDLSNKLIDFVVAKAGEKSEKQLVEKLCNYFFLNGKLLNSLKKEKMLRLNGLDFIDFYKKVENSKSLYSSIIASNLGKYEYQYGIITDEVVEIMKQSIDKTMKNLKRMLDEKTAYSVSSVIWSGVTLYLNKKEPQKALSFLKSILEKYPFSEKMSETNYSELLNNACWFFAEKGFWHPYLMSLLEKAAKIDPSPEHLDTLAHLYALKGEYSKALKIEKRAIDMLKKMNVKDEKLHPYLKFAEQLEKKLK